MLVDGIAHRIGLPVAAKIAVRDLTDGMDAGIGPPGAGDRGRLGVEPPQGLLHRLLHRRLVGLPLPAREGAAMIVEEKRVAGHGSP